MYDVLTRNIAKKGIYGMRSSSPASISLYLDSDVLRNPFQAILPTLPASQKHSDDRFVQLDAIIIY
jgi:hypothetical protein